MSMPICSGCIFRANELLIFFHDINHWIASHTIFKARTQLLKYPHISPFLCLHSFQCSFCTIHWCRERRSIIHSHERYNSKSIPTHLSKHSPPMPIHHPNLHSLPLSLFFSLSLVFFSTEPPSSLIFPDLLLRYKVQDSLLQCKEEMLEAKVSFSFFSSPTSPSLLFPLITSFFPYCKVKAILLCLFIFK